MAGLSFAMRSKRNPKRPTYYHRKGLGYNHLFSPKQVAGIP